MGKFRNCINCHWGNWSIEKPPCKECEEVGAFHKWQERKERSAPKPTYIGHREGG